MGSNLGIDAAPFEHAARCAGMAAIALPRMALALGAAVALPAPPAWAAEAAQAGAPEAILFVQLALLLLVGRLLGEAMQRAGQPAVMGYLLAGIVLGPSLMGVLWPQLEGAVFLKTAEQKSMIDAVSQIGILMLLLLTGMETDLKLVRRVGRAAILVSAAGVAVPFACGVILGELLPDSLLPKADQRFATAIFLGTALSISSVKIVALIVRDMNFMRRNLGQIIVASAIMEDTIGWVIVAVAFGLAASGRPDPWSVARIILSTAVFLGVSLTFGRQVVFRLIRWVNDNFVSEFAVITAILLVMFGMALITYVIGVQTVLGAFMAGVLIGESPILTRHIDEQLRGLIAAFFMPVFFGLSGLSTDLTILASPDLLLLAGALVVIASVGKFGGALLGAKLGRLSRRESIALACAMNARGSTEVIVASVGLSMGVLNQNLFTMIVAMAVITTMAMPPMLRWALARIPLGKEERIRLEREEFDARGFVPNLERLLLAADDSPNGTFASRLAGIIAGSGEKPITVLDLRRSPPAKGAPDGEGHEQDIKSAAETVTMLDAGPEEQKPGNVDVTTRTMKAEAHEAVAEEAEKGYGLLVIGIEKTRASGGGFTKEVTRLADGFDEALALVAARGAHVARALEPGAKILVPVNGTEASRRAAEVALAVARSNQARIMALYVASGPGVAGKQKPRRRTTATRRNEEAVLKEIAELGDRYDAKLRTALRVDVSADDAILKEARRGAYDLIILGVTRRPGETLFFGNMAATVLESSETSILFVAMEAGAKPHRP